MQREFPGDCDFDLDSGTNIQQHVASCFPHSALLKHVARSDAYQTAHA